MNKTNSNPPAQTESDLGKMFAAFPSFPFVKINKVTDVQATWRRFGWTPPSEVKQWKQS